MGATRFRQFALLVKKNYINQVVRNPVGFAKEIFWPCLIAVLFLWLRGLWNAVILPGLPFGQFEVKSWPPGLDAPYLNANNESEFILYYAPTNTYTDTIMQKSVDKMNNEYIKWYSYEEHMFDEVIYNPLLNNGGTPHTWDEIKVVVGAFVPWYRLNDRQWKEYVCKDRWRRGEEWTTISPCAAPTSDAEKTAWVKDKLIENIYGSNWDPCRRQYRTTNMYKMVQAFACPSSRDYSTEAINAARNMNPTQFLNEFQARMTTEEKNSMIRNTTEGIDAELRQYITNINRILHQPSSRAVNLTTICNNNNMDDVAAQIHSEHPRVKVIKHGFEDLKALEMYILSSKNDQFTQRRLGGVVFNKPESFADGYPETLDYSIRMPPSRVNYERGARAAFIRRRASRRTGVNWRTSLLKIPLQLNIPRGGGSSCTGGMPYYYSEGFTIIQDAIDSVFTSVKVGTDRYDSWRKYLARMPYGQFTLDFFPTVLQIFAPFLTMLATMSLILNAMKAIVLEKEMKNREYMKTMGASSAMQWASWTFYYLILTTIVVGSFTYLMCSQKMAEFSFRYSWEPQDLGNSTHYNVTEYEEKATSMLAVLAASNGFLVFITFQLNFLQTVWFMYFLSTFFTNSSTASGVAGCAHFFLHTPWGYIRSMYSDLSLGFKIFIGFIPELMIGELWYVISNLEGNGAGLNWNTMTTRITINNDLSVAELWFQMLFAIALYMALTLYIEQINPGEFGVALPLSFPFKKEYWFPPPPKTEFTKSKGQNVNCFESLPYDANVSVQMMGLRKVFTTIDGDKVAVDDLHLDICKGHITAFLGHNGAGKTTTMNMLTGMFQPTSGTAFVNGYDIRTNMNEARSSIGICPQFDILFPNLTIEEHLYFFAAMKGVPKEKLKAEVDEMVETMLFQPYLHNFPTELSGGWKRRLSVCIALVGGSSCIILDEPTSGMDPSTRRILWSILAEVKKTRTILLSTHFMDEADILGDRVCIMNHGVLHACGSSSFLKDKFGCGYHLMFSSNTSEFSATEAGVIAQTVQRVIPQATIDAHIGQDLNLVLPFDQVSKFPTLFNNLDEIKASLHIDSYGIMLTSMDEVFIKCTEDARKNTEQSQIRRGSARGSFCLHDEEAKELTKQIFVGIQDRQASPFTLFLMQIKTCVTKNVIVSIRERSMSYAALVMACVIIWGLMFRKEFTSRLNNPKNSPPLDLSTRPWVSSFGYTNQKMTYWVDESADGSLANELNSAMDGYVTDFNEWCTTEKAGTETCLALHNVANKTSDVTTNMIDTFDEYGPTMFDQTYFQGVGIGKTAFGYGVKGFKSANASYAAFNGQHYHTTASALNLMGSMLYRMAQDYMGDSPKGEIITYNHPLPLNATELSTVTGQDIGSNSSRDHANQALFAVCLICALMCREKVTENVSKSKHIQSLTGLPYFSYWISFFIIDLLKFAIMVIPVAYIFRLYDDPIFGWGWSWLYICFYMIICAWAMLPFMYLCSLYFIVPSTCVIALLLLVSIIGQLVHTWIAIWVMQDAGLDEENPPYVCFFSSIFGETFCATRVAIHNTTEAYFPPYTFLEIINKHYGNNESLYLCTQDDQYEQLCEEENITYNANYWAYEDETNSDGVGKQIQLLIYQGFHWFLVLVVFEMISTRLSFELVKRLFRSNQVRTGGNGKVAVATDEDVIAEAERVCAADNLHTDEVLVCRNLNKIYSTRTGPLNAVVDISFGVKPQTCFGLLGVNGAGKTTTFKMLTGDEQITSGDCWTASHSLVTDRAAAQKCVGYCPQFNALIDSLTGTETLQMYCGLRGLSRDDTANSVKELLNILDLAIYQNKPCGIYSGGNKRKLSVALAMIGEPPLLFLDEPSTGMDPGARHALWESIVKIQHRGSSVILTSHSMEECEALCSKLAIMVNGHFQCFGSVQHLRNRFGRGYSLDLTLSNHAHVSAVVNEIKTTFPGIKLEDEHHDFLVFDLPYVEKRPVGLGELFAKLENIKEKYNLASYSVKQRTLEELFLTFTKSQREDDRQAAV